MFPERRAKLVLDDLQLLGEGPSIGLHELLVTNLEENQHYLSLILSRLQADEGGEHEQQSTNVGITEM